MKNRRMKGRQAGRWEGRMEGGKEKEDRESKRKARALLAFLWGLESFITSDNLANKHLT